MPVLAVIPLGCFQIAMLLSVEFPDAQGDANSSKYTLVVRLGVSVAACVYLTVLSIAYGTLPLLVHMGLPLPVAIAIGSLSPLAVWLISHTYLSDWQNPAKWDSFAFYTIGLLVVTGIVEILAFLLLIGVNVAKVF